MIIPIDMNDITGTHATSLMAMPGDGAPHADRRGCSGNFYFEALLNARVYLKRAEL